MRSTATTRAPDTMPLSGGILSARRLVDLVAEAPGEGLVAAVVGPGGTGKSTLLHAVARAYRSAGATPGTAGGPVLVDDAHLLGAAALRRLVDVAGTRGARLVVAHRPWPLRPGLTTLRAAVAQRGVTVGLGRLDAGSVRERVVRLLGRDPGEATAAAVHEQSAGLPLLVDTVTRALSGAADRLRPPAAPLPAAVVERWRHLVDGLPDDTRLVLEALAVGAALEAAELATLTGLAAPRLATAVEAVRASGYVDENGRPAPFARTLLLAAAPTLRLRDMQRALVVAAGDPATTAARRCGSAALAGDLDAALRLADPVLVGPADAPERPLAVATAAAVLAHRGFPERSAALTASLPADHPTGPVWAVPALLAVGDAAGARAALAAATAAGCRGLGHDAGVQVAAGLLAAVDGDAQRGLAGLARAAVLLEPVAATTLLPDTPAALSALLALQTGEAGVADAALRRAAAGRHGGAPAQPRHLLLHGWVLLVRGRFGATQEALDRVGTGGRLPPREELFAAALQVALARRAGSASALTAAWVRARAALLDHRADLHTLLPLGELTVAAALLHDLAHLGPHLDDAHRVLHDLGDPVPWIAPLLWAQAQAAVVAGRRDDAERRVDALDGIGRHGAHPAALSAAARTWVQVRWGAVDPEAAIGAARGLADVGLPWEGAKLAGQAAARSDQRGAAAALHACARELFRSTDGGDDTAPAAEREPVPAVGDEPVLSERELEVGRLILHGLTYRQIGEQLYISAKTVENHVGRMRRRLGAGSRNELFDRLRTLVAGAGSSRPLHGPRG